MYKNDIEKKKKFDLRNGDNNINKIKSSTYQRFCSP